MSVGDRQDPILFIMVLCQFNIFFSFQIYLHDPVETQKLTIFVGQRLQQAQAVYGPTFKAAYLKDADPTVLKQVREQLGS